jgi:hypothetical protein
MLPVLSSHLDVFEYNCMVHHVLGCLIHLFHLNSHSNALFGILVPTVISTCQIVTFPLVFRIQLVA